MHATYHKYILHFKNPSGTSRGVFTKKEAWFIKIQSENRAGIGECGLLRGLSIDDKPDYEEKLKWACDHMHLGAELLWEELIEFPSIQFGIEQAFKSLQSETPFTLFPSEFTSGKAAIPINGLIWMGDAPFMREQIKQKIEKGFRCIKMKIGAIDFDTELLLLKSIREQFSKNDIEIRVDANGAFKPTDALKKLEKLAKLDIHSIEQPIKAGQPHEMAELCMQSPLPIALDEELIGVFDVTKKEELLQTIKPQYIILKPSLIGGYRGSDEWIQIAENHNVGWWATSALESNIGLNAIAQWTFHKRNPMYQGLGTGGLYINNYDSPLIVENGFLHYKPEKKWITDFKL
ncbi:o-succinylbenzoate synthase [Leptobacterium sp. I13]|uniref:o-succinylbenzoate synthase n=1 Tax=Leptobacterium meishanense TaxID=3128904 RepID=UPI0030EE8A16